MAFFEDIPIRVPEMKAVVSSNIDKIGFDYKNNILWVLFSWKGTLYRYFNVPASIYETMLEINPTALATSAHDEKSEENSIGRFFNVNVKSRSVPTEKWGGGTVARYAYEKVAEGVE